MYIHSKSTNSSSQLLLQSKPRTFALSKTLHQLIAFTITVILTLSFGFVPFVLGQESTSTNEVTGELTRIEDREITLDIDGSTQIYIVPEDILLELNEQESELSDLGLGDRVTLSLNEDNEVVQVQAISGDIINWMWWAIAIIALLILAVIISLIIKNATDKKNIKTTTATRVDN